jgi:molybdate transport system permease protein
MKTVFPLATATALGLIAAFLVLPVIAIFVGRSPGELLRALDDPTAQDALWLSLQTSGAAVVTVVALGTPAAWFLATRSFRGRALLIMLVELPLVLPPAVAGIALLACFGPLGIVPTGDALVLQTAGVIVALVFVAAPFHVRAAQAAFEAVDPTWLEASRTLGASEGRTFARIALPAALPGLAAGVALAWGRALGEFGATLMFAGSFRGITQTAPLAIYDRFGTDFAGALALSAVLVAISAGLLLGVKAGARRLGTR